MDRYDVEFDDFDGEQPRCSCSIEPNYLGEFVLYKDVEELIKTVKEYLTYDSCDGRIKYRQPLRNKLKELVK